MDVLFYNAITSKTARLLAGILGIRATKKPRPTDTVVIRWGTSAPFSGVDLGINPAESIRVAANGLLSLRLMHEKGVPAVVLYETAADIPDDGFPVIARGKANHHGGLDITLVETREDLVAARYYTKLENIGTELRVHVLGNEVYKVFRKDSVETTSSIIRTSKFGWGFVKVDHTQYYRKAQEVAVAAVAAHGLLFGAVDVGYNLDKSPVVFEVNTGPSLNAQTVIGYSEFLKRVIDEKRGN